MTNKRHIPSQAEMEAENGKLSADCKHLHAELSAAGVKNLPALKDSRDMVELNENLHLHLSQLKAIARGVPVEPIAPAPTAPAAKPAPVVTAAPGISAADPAPRNYDERVAQRKGRSIEERPTGSYDERVAKAKKKI